MAASKDADSTVGIAAALGNANLPPEWSGIAWLLSQVLFGITFSFSKVSENLHERRRKHHLLRLLEEAFPALPSNSGTGGNTRGATQGGGGGGDVGRVLTRPRPRGLRERRARAFLCSLIN